MPSSSIYILPSYPCPNFWPDLGHLSHIPFVYQSSVSLHLFFTIIHLLLYDRFHTKSSTNYKQDHVWSPFLRVCVMTSITISIFDVPPKLNIQLHSWDSSDCNYPLFKSKIPIFNIVMPYNSLWLFFRVLHKTPNPIYCSEELVFWTTKYWKYT